MADENFVVGDVVGLKSGGPKMTVVSVGEDDTGDPTVWCVWFEESNKVQDSFPPSALQKR
jgi:uncharacterized protein YodC (DUF2158 family)